MKIEQMKILEELANIVLENTECDLDDINCQIQFYKQSMKATRLDKELSNKINDADLTEEQYKELCEVYKDFNERLEKIIKNIEE